MSSTFADLGVPADLVSVLSRRGIIDPFPIQAAAIPDALAGRDICGRAPTGSGKTVAFGVPLVAGLRGTASRGPEALVLVPTRELCTQVADELTPLAAARGSSVVAVYGGVSDRPQRRALSRGAAVVVACPGRLEDLLAQRVLSLDEVTHVVVDEADRMADMGFLPAVRRIVDATSRGRQTQLFSATLGGPAAELSRRYQTGAARHEVDATDEGLQSADHEFLTVRRSARAGVTAELIGEAGSTVVFCRTRHGATRLTRQLTRLGVNAVELHGGRSQSQREKALAGFSSGRVQALVATDVAARGIHVEAVACVVHYDLPGDSETYVHRSGRTARAGASGSVVALVDENSTKVAAELQQALGIDTARRRPAPIGSRASDSGKRVVEPAGGSPGTPGTGPKQANPAGRSPKAPGPAGRRGKRVNGRKRAGGGVQVGRVKSFDPRRGYGFIARERGADLFVHWSNIVGEGFRSLEEGQDVEFEVGPGRKGDEAFGVRAA